MEGEEKRCTLSDKELTEKVSKLISGLARHDGVFKMSIPVDFNNDSDMLLCELVARFERLITPASLIPCPPRPEFLPADEMNEAL